MQDTTIPTPPYITLELVRFFWPLQIGPMNIGNPTEFTIKQLAEMTIRLTKSSSKIIYKPLPQVRKKRRGL